MRPRRLVADVADPLRARRHRGCLRRAHLRAAEQGFQEVLEPAERAASRAPGVSCRPVLPLGHCVSLAVYALIVVVG